MTTAVLPVTLDTYIASGYATTSYDTAAVIATGERNDGASAERTILQIAGLTDGSIPAGVTIQSAILTLTVQADYCDNARTHRWYRMKRTDISIADATWNIYKTATNWSTAGGFHTDDCEQTDIGSLALANNLAVNSVQNFTLTASAIQEIVRGTWTANFLLGKADTETSDAYRWHSSEAATEGYRPYLTVTYSVPGGTQVLII